MFPKSVQPKKGRESVWDYPRPPRLEEFHRRLEIFFGGVTIADTIRAKRVLETSHPPVYYIPPDDVKGEYLKETLGVSWCEWKGRARYYDLTLGDRTQERVAWTYPDPDPAFSPIRDHFAFYAGPMDACFVNGEQVTPQPGRFYGGWITRNIVGPFKGDPRTEGW
jgi:uncharacterized protein (DUF427 family)